MKSMENKEEDSSKNQGNQNNVTGRKFQLNTFVSIANIVSSLALIISIVILINEYKRSDLINEKTIENLIYSRMMELDRLLIENPDMSEIVLEAQSKPDSMSASDKLRYLAYEHIFYDSWETLWVGFQNKVVSEETWNDWNNWFLREYKKKPPLSLEGNLENFTPDFLDHIRKYDKETTN